MTDEESTETGEITDPAKVVDAAALVARWSEELFGESGRLADHLK
jgi:hypothetical protein